MCLQRPRTRSVSKLDGIYNFCSYGTWLFLVYNLFSFLIGWIYPFFFFLAHFALTTF